MTTTKTPLARAVAALALAAAPVLGLLAVAPAVQNGWGADWPVGAAADHPDGSARTTGWQPDWNDGYVIAMASGWGADAPAAQGPAAL